jgi:catechol 2,3-dioxygenase-like lactoylglutathione lyase family enzyme
MRVNDAIVFVSDMDRSVAFYRDVAGLPLRRRLSPPVSLRAS